MKKTIGKWMIAIGILMLIGTAGASDCLLISQRMVLGRIFFSAIWIAAGAIWVKVSSMKSREGERKCQNSEIKSAKQCTC